MAVVAKTVQVRLFLQIAPGERLGPGKADLLQGIRDTGSISAAGKRMGMSYKRAWLLVDAVNGYFAGPLVEATKGGKTGGGAQLTPLGDLVLGLYRQMEGLGTEAIAPPLAELDTLLRKDEPQ
jgi:molybdate transport system regulatory protein